MYMYVTVFNLPWVACKSRMLSLFLNKAVFLRTLNLHEKDAGPIWFPHIYWDLGSLKIWFAKGLLNPRANEMTIEKADPLIFNTLTKLLI